MDVVLKSLHFIALVAMLGGAFFWHAVWGAKDSPGSGTPHGRSPHDSGSSHDARSSRDGGWTRDGGAPNGDAARTASAALAARVRAGVLVGVLAFSLSGIAETFRVASQVIDLSDFGMVLAFFERAYMGRFTLLRAVFALVFACLFFLGEIVRGRAERQPGKSSPAYVAAALKWLLVPAGAAVLWSVSATSHLGAYDQTAPLVSDMIHLAAAACWGGGLLYLALIPWRHPALSVNGLSLKAAGAIGRFSKFALGAVILVAATGASASYLQVYGVDAVRTTPYGRALLVKILLFLVVVGTAGVNLLYFLPGLRKAARIERFLQWTIRLEAVLVIGVLLAAAKMTTLAPPNTAPGAVSGVWTTRTGPWDVRLEMESDLEPGKVSLDIYVSSAAEAAPPPFGTSVSVALSMPGHGMGNQVIEARPVSPGFYGADGFISMAGDWEARVRVTEPIGVRYEALFRFRAATGSLEEGKVRRIDVTPAWIIPQNRLVLLVAILLVAMAAVGVWGGQTRHFASWATPFGLIVMAFSGYLVLSLVLVNAYPTAYVPNPLPYTKETVDRGRELFLANCAVCHGEQGKGDGAVAVAMNPPPADLTSEHVDDHTDGDIFWWVTHGIPGSGMPGFESVLSEEERWSVVHFVRSLRHGISAFDASEVGAE